jgi:predicted O-linked N-acetylglucosamine transferase (SPINDLY family)
MATQRRWVFGEGSLRGGGLRRLLLALFALCFSTGQLVDQESFLVQGISKRLLSDATYMHRGGDFIGAVGACDIVLAADSENIEAYFMKGTALMHLGDIHASASSFNNVLKRDSLHLKARLNIATLHHRFGKLDDAIIQYEIGISDARSLLPQHSSDVQLASLYNKLIANLAVAYTQSGLVKESRALLLLTLTYHLERQRDTCSTDDSSLLDTKQDSEDCIKSRQKSVFALTHLYRLQRATVDFNRIEYNLACVYMQTMKSISNGQYLDAGFTPFDSLLEPLHLSQRFAIASAASVRYPKVAATSYSRTSSSTQFRLGFLSFDFNDHPTCLLVKGIFDQVREMSIRGESIQLYSYSYGKNDNSSCRRDIEVLSHRFYDVSEMTPKATADLVRSDDLDILVDLQGHTLGNRLSILAERPAPIQVAYLIFPGTSGLSFIDSIVADRHVLPAEHAKYFSEGLVLVPSRSSYQVSSPAFHNSKPAVLTDDERIRLREKYGLPTDPRIFVYANFNKHDKIDKQTLEGWFGILSRVPNSVLWLLAPSFTSSDQKDTVVRDNINNLATSFGIAGVSRRIFFASRENKAEHIKRHCAADLFLDTYTYGAHSTATDALIGQLPVLSIIGDSFPSRVAVSLISSLCDGEIEPICSTLLPSSVKQFQDSAVRLATHPRALESIRKKLFNAQVHKKGIFCEARGVDDFLSTLYALAESRSSAHRNVIIVAGRGSELFCR